MMNVSVYTSLTNNHLGSAVPTRPSPVSVSSIQDKTGSSSDNVQASTVSTVSILNQLLINASKSALIVSAWVVGMPCGKPGKRGRFSACCFSTAVWRTLLSDM